MRRSSVGSSEDIDRELRDRQAIKDVLVQYALGIDRRDIALVRDCFAPDAEYDGTLAATDMKEALAKLEAHWHRYERTQHLLGNQIIELDGESARSETYVIAHQQLRAGDELRLRVVALRYEDTLALREGRWRITRRRARTLFALEEPLPDGLASMAGERS